MSRLERLINLVAALLDTSQPLPASEIRRRVPGYSEDQVAFRRAFERDKETLREMAIPIVVEHVIGADATVDGYRIPPEDYYLPELELAEDELAALHLASAAVHLEGANGMSALWKLGGALAEEGPAPTTAALPGSSHLGELFRASAESRRVRIRYRDQLRTVDPHRLAFRNGHWYLGATDLDKQAPRWFRLDRMTGPVEAEGPGTARSVPGPAEEAPPPPWATGGDRGVPARILVDADQAAWAASHVGASAVRARHPDGSVEIELEVTNRPAFRSFVLGFLDHAVVLGPDDLRRDIVDWLRSMTEETCAPATG